MMRRIKLFLASSSELKNDREQFEIFIYRKCKAWFERGIFLHLDIWEDFLDAMSLDGLQHEYNQAVKDSDIFVLLVWNKVGPYTSEEFCHAFGQFSAETKPFIFTYFRTPHTTTSREELQSLWAFEDELKKLHHYKTTYQNIEGLREHFGNQLDKLAANGFIEFKPDDFTNLPIPSQPPPRIFFHTGGSAINPIRKSYDIFNLGDEIFRLTIDSVPGVYASVSPTIQVPHNGKIQLLVESLDQTPLPELDVILRFLDTTYSERKQVFRIPLDASYAEPLAEGA